MISHNELDKLQLFFITGRIRSGTTLMNNVLNADKRIFIPQESPFILFLYNKYHKTKHWNESKLISFYNDLWKEYRLTQFWELNKDAADLKELILNLGKTATFQRLCKLVIWFQAKRNGKTPKIIGDKNPSYTLYFPLLSKIFPHSKFIILVRDPRSNMLSCKKVSFDSNDPCILAIRWKKCYKELNKFEHTNNKALVINYNKLITDPEEQLRSVTSHINLDFDEEVLNFHNTGTQLKSWKHFSLRPFDKSKTSNWISEIKENELSIIQWLTSKEITELGLDIIKTKHLGLLAKMSLIPNIISGHTLNYLEQMIYRLPLKTKSKIIHKYRIRTKTI